MSATLPPLAAAKAAARSVAEGYERWDVRHDDIRLLVALVGRMKNAEFHRIEVKK